MAAVIKIEIQTSGNVDQVKQQVEDLGRSAEKSGGGFSAMGEIATGALRAVGEAAVNLAGAAMSKIGQVLGDSISAARESNAVAAQTAQVIKSTGSAAGVTAQHVLDYASALSAASGKSLFGDEQIAESSNLLLTFTNIKGATLDAATAISVDMAQALGGAPKDAAIQLGKALNDPVKGITALTRVGVTFDDQQKATIQAMQEAGDTAGAQAIILAELNKEFGGSAQAAADADGGFAQFHDRLGEVEETIGKAVLPILGQLLSVVNNNLLPVIESAANAIGPFVETLQAAFAAGGLQAVVDQLGQMVPEIAPLTSLVNQLASAFGVGASDGGGLAGGITNAIYSLDTISPLFDLIGDGINTLITDFTSAETPIDGFIAVLSDVSPTFAAVYAIVQATMPAIEATITEVLGVISAFWAANGADIMATVTQTWNTIKQIIAVALPLIEGIITGVLAVIVGFIRDHGKTITQVLTDTWNILKNVIQGALAIIQGVLTAALAIFKGDWSGAWEAIKTMSVTVTLALGNIIKSFLDIIAGYFGTSLKDLGAVWSHNWDAMKEAATKFADEAVTIGKNIIHGIIDGVKNGVGALENAVSDAANSALDAAKNALGISSPSEAMAQGVGVPIITGVMQGIQDTIPALIQLIGNTGQTIVDAHVKWAQTVKTEFNKTVDDINNQIAKLGDSISNTINDAFMGAASLDRAKARAIAALDDISEAQRKSVQDQLAVADAAASKIADPAASAKFFKLRSDQIFELAKLQDSLATASDDATRQHITDQIALITDAQTNELAGFQQSATAPGAALIAQLQSLQQQADSFFTSKGGSNAGLPGQLDGNATINAISHLINQLSGLQGNSNSTVTSSNSVFNYQPSITTSAPIPAPPAAPHIRALSQV